ncbi:hypothetical protein ONS95_001487 [Cadophora gregata]|uniref:uncharacterized protein n=1 Tax=Cadophora gregata TaxID=51156 RepID=UPI0026DD6898|nr:uncharacterized protein ONS95_001487 [Cadophora gregata]KAK0111110.1 hypothetical protein ONS95_001487 [Cadophora gregata]
MLPLYILLTCLSTYARGRPTDPSEFCLGGCELALSIFKFNESSSSPADLSTLRAKAGCDNEFQIPSLYLCLSLFCTEDERIVGLNGMNETCRSRSNVTLPPFSIVDRYSDEDIERLRHLQVEEIPNGADFVFNEIAVPSIQVFKLAFDTLDAVYFELRIHNTYGCAMYYFWAIVIIIGLSSHLLPYLLTFQNRNRRWQKLLSNDLDGIEEPFQKSRSSIFDTTYTLFKQHITVPATFGHRRSQNIGWCTIPTRVQSLAIGAFIIVNIVLCSCSYRVFENNIYWPRVYDQGLRYFADRTGIIATANLPLIWIFGIRNNALVWLTGWDFATYNNFHRWVARVSTLEAVLHSLAYTVMIVAREGSVAEAWAYYLTYYQRRYFVNGVLATIFMVGILVASVYPLRRNFYEIFLWLHIILSILVIVTMYFHIEIFRGYTTYIYPCILIWLLDRLLRFLRILSFNPRFWATTATVTYSSSSNIVRLSVTYTSSFVKPRPGTFYYVYVIDRWRFWENHPFTLGYATPEVMDGDGKGSVVYSPAHPSSMSLGTISPPRRATSPPQQYLLSTETVSSELSPVFPYDESAHLLSSSSTPTTTSNSTSTAEPSTLTFLIRPYTGFTSRLRTSCLASHSHTTTHRILLEGPYGSTQPLNTYINILFIVGGTGIAVPLSYMRMLTNNRKSNSNSNGSTKTTTPRCVKIVWAVRERAFLDDVISQDFSSAGFGDGDDDRSPYHGAGTGTGGTDPPNEQQIAVNLTAYITGDTSIDPRADPHIDPHPPIHIHSQDEESKTKTKNKTHNTSSSCPLYPRQKTTTNLPLPLNLTILPGRPNVPLEILNTAQSLQSTSSTNPSARTNLAVITCGPSLMADEARRAVVDVLGRGVSEVGVGVGIEYFEESFNW